MSPKIILLFVVCLFSTSVFSQNLDSSRIEFLEKIKQIEKKELESSLSELDQHRAEIKRARVIEDLLKVGQKAKAFLKKGIDSAGIKIQLEQIKEWNTIVQKGVDMYIGPTQTQRNLSVSSKLNKELIFKIEQEDDQLGEYLNQLIVNRNHLDSLMSDSSLYNFPKDTLGLTQYYLRLKSVFLVLKPIDSSLQKAIVSLDNLKNRLVVQKNELVLENDELQEQRKQLFRNSLKKEFIETAGWTTAILPFSYILNFSFLKEQLAFIFYLQDNIAKVFFLVMLVFLLFYFIRTLKRKIEESHLLFRYPLLSAVIIVFGLFQFLFLDPPFIFYLWFWLIPGISLTVVFWNYITKFWMKFWLCILGLFTLVAADNLILLASNTERVILVVLAFLGLATGFYFLFNWNKHSHELKERYIKYFLYFLMGMQIVSIMFNFYGSYNLSKSIMVSGYFGVVTGILLLWTVRLMNDVLFFATETYKAQDKKLFYINFEKVGSKVPSFFYFLLILGWFVLVSRNFYLYNQLAEPISNWMFEERTIGEYSFSITGITTFIVIIFISFFVSRIVSFIASEPSQSSENSDKSTQNGLGSWILLIRIAIISMGLFLAFAAAGIPLDKITIILGALSVGIGFGLQTLINNLVSGLILAFEKPVNVGDIVEVMGKSGTMKSIGFRSSVITTWDGANLIISNGDLMNAQLLNWSQNKGFRRLELKLNITLGVDLNQVHDIVQKVLQDNNEILKYPKHIIEFHQIVNASAELSIYFWVKKYGDAGRVMSNLIVDIDAVFNEHKIAFATPTQNIVIHDNDNDKKQAN